AAERSASAATAAAEQLTRVPATGLYAATAASNATTSGAAHGAGTSDVHAASPTAAAPELHASAGGCTALQSATSAGASAAFLRSATVSCASASRERSACGGSECTCIRTQVAEPTAGASPPRRSAE